MPTRSVDYHRVASLEAREAVVWYARRSRMAARNLVQELEDARQKIATAAESYPIDIRHVRWLKLRRYPFRIFFCILDSSRCRIVAVAHTSRRGRYWLWRLSRP